MSFWSKLDKNVLHPIGKAWANAYTGGAYSQMEQAKLRQKAEKEQQKRNLEYQAQQEAADAAWLAQQSNASNYQIEFGPNGETAYERLNRTSNPRGDQNAPAKTAAPVVIGGGVAIALLLALLK